MELFSLVLKENVVLCKFSALKHHHNLGRITNAQVFSCDALSIPYAFDFTKTFVNVLINPYQITNPDDGDVGDVVYVAMVHVQNVQEVVGPTLVLQEVVVEVAQNDEGLGQSEDQDLALRTDSCQQRYDRRGQHCNRSQSFHRQNTQVLHR